MICTTTIHGWMQRLLLAVALGSSVPTAAARTLEHVLDNGLKVVVREDHRAPVVVSQIWYKVGSSYETGGTTGVSHVLEHMMFKGTPNYGPGEFNRIIAEEGGRDNAFTGTDYTAYFQSLAADRLEVSFRLEADRMRHLLLDTEEFAKELQVVIEERRLRTEDKPGGLLYEQFNAAAYAAHPYRNPVIGWMADLEAMQVADLRDWYRSWYMPNNATVVVVGDVTPESVFRLAERHFGVLEAGQPPDLKPRHEPPQRGERRVTVRVPAQLPQLMIGFPVPTLGPGLQPEAAWEPYALEVLAGILDGGSSARFSSQLVRGTEVAAAASAGYRFAQRAAGLFMLSGTPARDKTVADLEAALLQQIKTLRETPVGPEELARVKRQVVAAEVYQQDSVFYQAMRIGLYETIGLDWQQLDEYVAGVRAVTPEQVQTMARRYFDTDRMTVATLDPLPMNTEQPPAATALPHAH